MYVAIRLPCCTCPLYILCIFIAMKDVTLQMHFPVNKQPLNHIFLLKGRPRSYKGLPTKKNVKYLAT